jgi:hypothetical protein
MSHYAIIDRDNIVRNVIVVDDELVANSQFGNPEFLIKTSYNTHGGVHVNGGTPLRKNFAGIGYTYDTQRDAFIPPKPYASWVLNESTCLWESPVAMPNDGKRYKWDENITSWIEVTQ